MVLALARGSFGPEGAGAWCSALVLTFTPPEVGQAETAPPAAVVQVLDHGVVCQSQGGSIVTGQDTIDGEVITGEFDGFGFDHRIRVVPALAGLSFGVVVGFGQAPAAGYLEASVTHPPMGGTGMTRQGWQVEAVQGKQAFVGYRLEDDFELVTGRWTLRLGDGDAVVLQQDFDLVDPASPAVADYCRPAVVPGS